MNEVVTISGIVISYEIFVLIIYGLICLIHKLNKSNKVSRKVSDLFSKLFSPVIILNFFIIVVMYVTKCNVDIKLKLLLTFIKITLLIIIFKSVKLKLSIFNCVIGLSILLIYYLLSDINKVYSCNIKKYELIITVLISILFYIGTYCLLN
jgi:hypothetical protein